MPSMGDMNRGLRIELKSHYGEVYVECFGPYFALVLKDSTVQAFCAAISQALKEARLRKKLSMSAVAERAGISQQMVSYVERGIRKPTLDTVFRISVALEVDLGRVVRAAAQESGK